MSTESYKESFTKFLLSSGALTFGDFTLKSGRKSPYMINAGHFNTGWAISRLGCFYARAIHEKVQLGVIPQDTGIIFGSAYKGIPLATAASIALNAAFDIHVGWCFNRKEAKDHGEGGVFVGKQLGPGDKILIIDDVMTAGTALRETVNLIHTHAPEAEIVGSVIAVDRAERGGGTAGGGRLSAVAEAQYELGFPVFSIIDIDEIVSALKVGLEFPAPAQPSADSPSTPYRQPKLSAIDRYPCDLCEDREEKESNVILPTAEQIAAIETYLKEHRAG
ncbi:orotate phosphoribosyltransferase [Clostridia bacterium]|nr:orotate phosphoribosyltransferase [Clostridia bacterium]